MTEIHHVNQQVRFDDFLERRLERLDQSVRQFAQETDGVREEEPLLVWKGQTARRGIEGREKSVLRDQVGAGEQI